jgi:hypothetical protein
MTNATPARKQTAANNAFLAAVKEAFAPGIYRRVAEILNGQGEAAAREYIRRNVSLSF